MSYCREEGKDQIIFVTKEEHDENPIQQDDYDDEQEGLINQDGSINWDCPCLGGMASGPCGVEFRDSFSCFHYSTEEVKGSDCIENFRSLQDCMTKYPDYYTRRSSRESDEEHVEDDDDDNSKQQDVKDQEKDSTEDSIQSDGTESAKANESKAL